MTWMAWSRLDLFNLDETRREARQVAELCLRAAREFRVMIDHLPNYKTIPWSWRRRLRSETSRTRVMTSTTPRALSRLFHEDLKDPRCTLAWLRLFDRMEMCMDAFDKAAGVVRSVVMKSA